MGDLRRHMQGIEAGVGHVARRMPGLPVKDVMLLRLLKLAADGLTRRVIEVVRPQGLNESDFRVLMQLYSSPSGRAFPGELCLYVVQTRTNMTRIADALVRRGLVTRTPNEQDRRRIELRITTAGKRFVDKLLPRLLPDLRASFSVLSAADKRLMRALLERLIDSIDTVAETRG
ncbi:MAG: MarR family transcriptional regulator [Rhodanobacteraceae bacterium]